MEHGVARAGDHDSTGRDNGAARRAYRGAAPLTLVSLLFHDVYERDPRESGFASDAADRYKLSIDDFDAQLASLASAAVRGATVRGSVAPSHPRTIAPEEHFLLTFDDGGVSYYTHIADRLEERGWRGRCLVTTDCIGQRGFLDAAQIRELHARGHVIGTHSASHPTRFSTLSDEEMRSEWTRSREAL